MRNVDDLVSFLGVVVVVFVIVFGGIAVDRARKRRPLDAPDGYLKHPFGMTALGWGISAGFVIMAIGRLMGSEIGVAVLTLVTAGIIFFFAQWKTGPVFQMTRVGFNEIRPFNTKREFDWLSIKEVTVQRGTVRVESRSGSSARVHLGLIGAPEFARSLLENVQPGVIKNERTREVLEEAGKGIVPTV